MSKFGFSRLSQLKRLITGQHFFLAFRTLGYRKQRQNSNVGFYALAATFTSGFAAYKLQCTPFSSLHTIYADSVESEPTEEEQASSNKEGRSRKWYDRTTWRDSGSISLDDHLQNDALIYRPDMPCGIARYDVCAVPSNIPGSCYASCTIGELPSHYWIIFGIYDGRNGNTVSHDLFTNLPKAIIDALVDVYSKHSYLPSFHVDLGYGPEIMDYWTAKGMGRPYPRAEEIDAALKRGFMSLDNIIVAESAERALRLKGGQTTTDTGHTAISSYDDVVASLAKAHAASSALVALYESDVRQLRLAIAGNSRAVLGRRIVDYEGKEVYEAHVLTADQKIPVGFLDDPPRRDEHNSRTLTYSFGDGPSKWSTETRKRIYDLYPFFGGDRPREKATAEPVISTVETQPGDFMILANRGFWASLTNEEAVGLVGLWLKKHEKFAFKDRNDHVEGVYDPETGSIIPATTPYSRVSPQIRSSVFTQRDVFDPSDLPISCPREDDTFMYRKWGITKKFVVVDLNVAQHLVRNSLGGANRDVMEALLKMTTPRSRQYRDDVVVQVAFFT